MVFLDLLGEVSLGVAGALLVAAHALRGTFDSEYLRSQLLLEETFSEAAQSPIFSQRILGFDWRLLYDL